MRKKLTAEQEAARDARRQKFRQLWKQVAAMSDVQRIEFANKLGIVTCDGHQLSLGNTILVALQNSSASVVGGFRQWLKHGRAVAKGQHGQMIWIPCTKQDKADATPSTTEPVAEDAGDTRFIIGTVFDINQTQEVEVA